MSTFRFEHAESSQVQPNNSYVDFGDLWAKPPESKTLSNPDTFPDSDSKQFFESKPVAETPAAPSLDTQVQMKVDQSLQDLEVLRRKKNERLKVDAEITRVNTQLTGRIIQMNMAGLLQIGLQSPEQGLFSKISKESMTTALSALDEDQLKRIDSLVTGAYLKGSDEELVEKFAIAIKLEALDGDFGPVSQTAFRSTNDWINNETVKQYKKLASSGLAFTIDGSINMPSIQIADNKAPMSPSAFRKWIAEDLTVDSLQKGVEARTVQSNLLFDVKSRPTLEQMNRFNSNLRWVGKNDQLLNVQEARLAANRQSAELKNQFGIEKKGWQPPKDDAELTAYRLRALEAAKLITQVVQLADTIRVLKMTDGYNSDALDQNHFPGLFKSDGSIELNIPDGLEPTPENERQFQKFREWVNKYGPGVERILESSKTFGPLRYGESLEPGVIGLDENNNVVDRDQAKTLVKYDYVHNKPEITKNTDGDYEVRVKRGYYGDDGSNIQYWNGTKFGEKTLGPIKFKENDLVPVQDNAGNVSFVKAKDLKRYIDTHELYHHLGKIGSVTADAAFVATGGVLAKTAMKLGKSFYVGTNTARVIVGGSGVLEPTFRQMGETGKILSSARHNAMMLDIAGGVFKGGVKVLTGKSLETASQMQILKAVEASKSMNKIQKASGGAFAAYNVYIIPSMLKQVWNGTPADFKLDKNIEHAFPSVLDKAAMNKQVNSKDTFIQYSQESNGPKLEKAQDIFRKALKYTGNSEYAEPFKQGQLMDSLVGGKQELVYSKTNDPADKPEPKVTAEEEKVASAIALLTIKKQEQPTLTLDTVLASRQVAIPSLIDFDPESGNVTITDRPSVKQDVTVRDGIAVLEKATMDSKSGELRLMAADCLYKTGAWGPAKYNALCQEILKQPTTPENKDIKVLAWMRATEMLQQRKLQESTNFSQFEKEQIAYDSYGLSSAVMGAGMQRLAENETDPDLKALAACLVHLGESPDSFDLDKYKKLFEENKNTPGAFEKIVVADLKTALSKSVSQGDPAEIEDAREGRLFAAKTIGTMQKQQIKEYVSQTKLNEAVAGTLAFDEDVTVNNETSVKAIDYLAKNKQTLTKHQSELMLDGTHKILALPYTTDSTVALAKLQIVDLLPQIFAADKTNNPAYRNQVQRDLVEWLSDDSIRRSWGQHSDMRLAAIKGLSHTGSNGAEVLAAIQGRLKYNSGTQQFLEPDAAIRKAALQAAFVLSPKQFTSGGDKDPTKINVDDLLSVERDPQTVAKLYEIQLLLSEPLPDSPEYLKRFQAAMESIAAAPDLSISVDTVKALTKKYDQLKMLHPDERNHKVGIVAGQKYKEPYTGIDGWIQDHIIDTTPESRAKEHRARDSANWLAKNECNAEARGQVKNLGDFNNYETDAEKEAAVKTLFFFLRDSSFFAEGEGAKIRLESTKTIKQVCVDRTYPNADSMKKLIVDAVLKTDAYWDHESMENLLDSVDALVQQNVMTKIEAKMLIMKALGNQYEREFKPGQPEHRSWVANQLSMIDRLHRLRVNPFAADAEIQALRGNEKFCAYFGGSKDPSVKQRAAEYADALTYGVSDLQIEAGSNWGDNASVMANTIDLAAKDTSFNYARACVAIFKGTKGLPITDKDDPRREVLHKCLRHENERVRLAAAIALADSKVAQDLAMASNELIELEAHGSQNRYRQEARAIIVQMVARTSDPTERSQLLKKWSDASGTGVDAQKNATRDQRIEALAIMRGEKYEDLREKICGAEERLQKKINVKINYPRPTNYGRGGPTDQQRKADAKAKDSAIKQAMGTESRLRHESNARIEKSLKDYEKANPVPPVLLGSMNKLKFPPPKLGQ
jgi:hypothetical protein